MSARSHARLPPWSSPPWAIQSGASTPAAARAKAKSTTTTTLFRTLTPSTVSGISPLAPVSSMTAMLAAGDWALAITARVLAAAAA